MKILVVSPYPPLPPLAGGRRRIFEQVRTWSERHEVHLACLIYNQVEEAQLNRFIPKVQHFACLHKPGSQRDASGLPTMASAFWDAEFEEKVHHVARQNEYDWIVVEHSYAAPYVENVKGRKILHAHNIEYRLLAQLREQDEQAALAWKLCGNSASSLYAPRTQWMQLRDYERSVWATFDIVVAVSQEEASAIHAAAPGSRVVVTENCSSEKSLPSPNNLQGPSLTFVGALNYLPNVDAIVHLGEQIVPAIRRHNRSVNITIAGREPPPELVDYCNSRGMMVVSDPPVMGQLLTTNSVMLAPLRWGAGTRIKALDALAMGVPLVASSFAVEGLNMRPSRDYVCADSPEAMVTACISLLESDTLRKAISKRGLRYSARRRTWGEVFRRQEDMMLQYAAVSPDAMS